MGIARRSLRSSVGRVVTVVPEPMLGHWTPESQTISTQLLFSHKPNPQTVLFVGYSDNRLGLRQIDLTQTDRTFSVKLGYAWIL